MGLSREMRLGVAVSGPAERFLRADIDTCFTVLGDTPLLRAAKRSILARQAKAPARRARRCRINKPNTSIPTSGQMDRPSGRWTFGLGDRISRDSYGLTSRRSSCNRFCESIATLVTEPSAVGRSLAGKIDDVRIVRARAAGTGACTFRIEPSHER
jgi:hypothetical protein